MTVFVASFLQTAISVVPHKEKKIKPDQNWDEMTAMEIQAYIRILIYIRLRFTGNS
jgi:hypothetical protein